MKPSKDLAWTKKLRSKVAGFRCKTPLDAALAPPSAADAWKILCEWEVRSAAIVDTTEDAPLAAEVARLREEHRAGKPVASSTHAKEDVRWMLLSTLLQLAGVPTREVDAQLGSTMATVWFHMGTDFALAQVGPRYPGDALCQGQGNPTTLRLYAASTDVITPALNPMFAPSTRYEWQAGFNYFRRLREHLFAIDDEAFARSLGCARAVIESFENLPSADSSSKQSMETMLVYAFGRESSWAAEVAKRSLDQSELLVYPGLVMASLTDADLALRFARENAPDLLTQLHDAPLLYDMIEGLGAGAAPALREATSAPYKKPIAKELDVAIALAES